MLLLVGLRLATAIVWAALTSVLQELAAAACHAN